MPDPRLPPCLAADLDALTDLCADVAAEMAAHEAAKESPLVVEVPDRWTRDMAVIGACLDAGGDWLRMNEGGEA